MYRLAMKATCSPVVYIEVPSADFHPVELATRDGGKKLRPRLTVRIIQGKNSRSLNEDEPRMNTIRHKY